LLSHLKKLILPWRRHYLKIFLIAELEVGIKNANKKPVLPPCVNVYNVNWEDRLIIHDRMLFCIKLYDIISQ
ncbi:hypothetical protein L9F63_010745, partial [Diploptera punctata]